jgi:5-formyltetrahydrofolate cyclo-ligase
LLTIGMSKRSVREAALSARRALSAPERAARSEQIARHVLALDVFERAQTIAVYAALGAEVDTTLIAAGAESRGKRLAFPRAAGERGLAFSLATLETLVLGPFGTREPPPGAPLVEPSSLGLVLVPGVAFDLQCRRLGRGRGHYDATLAALPAGVARIGLAFEVQLVDEVPLEPHDVVLDAVVTESRVVFRLPSGAATGRSSR